MKRLKASVEDKIIESNIPETKISNAEAKNKILDHIVETTTSIDKGLHIQVFESTKENGVIFNKSKGKRSSYFVASNNSNSCIISNKSPRKEKTASSSKITSSKLGMKYLILTMAC